MENKELHNWILKLLDLNNLVEDFEIIEVSGRYAHVEFRFSTSPSLYFEYTWINNYELIDKIYTIINPDYIKGNLFIKKFIAEYYAEQQYYFNEKRNLISIGYQKHSETTVFDKYLKKFDTKFWRFIFRNKEPIYKEVEVRESNIKDSYRLSCLKYGDFKYRLNPEQTNEIIKLIVNYKDNIGGIKLKQHLKKYDR